LPQLRILDVLFRSDTGKSLLECEQELTVEDLSQYSATEQTREQALRILSELGFEFVSPPTPFGVSIVGPQELVRKVFGDALTVPLSLKKWIEAVRIPPPVEFYPQKNTP